MPCVRCESRAVDDRTVCFLCRRAVLGRVPESDEQEPDRAAAPPRSPFGNPLIAREIEHRRSMLAHLRRAR
jgi:hypothetical protein